MFGNIGLLSKRRVLLLALAGLIFFPRSVISQESRGTITGTVTDQQGAVVPGVEIQLRNIETNTVTTVQTNEAGAYTAPFLEPGRYSVAASLAAFKRALRENIELHVGDRLQIDFKLEVGAVTESVTVSAEAEMLETGTASKGQVIDAAKVRDLPSMGRNPFLLAALATGVDNWLFRTKQSSYGRPYDGPGAQMMMNGMYARYEILLDGVPNTPSERASAAIYMGFVPSPDAIEEFKVQTNTYDAQYGRTSGAVVNSVLKSGTNKLHGSLFHYFRNDVLNANTFESNWGNKPKAIMRWNEPGAQFDGPVYIPKIYDGRNRTFFMFSWESIRNSNPSPKVLTVPTLDQLAGDFSKTIQANGQPIVMYDPLTTQQVGGAYVRQPFADNRIPAARMDPVALKMLPYFAKPNTAGTATGLNNYVISPNSMSDVYNSYATRIDQQISPNHKLSGRWVTNNRSQFFPTDGFPKEGSPGYLHWRNNWGGSLETTDIFSPTLVLNTRYSFLRHPFGLQMYGDLFDPSPLGFPDPLIKQLPRLTFPGISLAEYSGPSTGDSQYSTTNTHTLASTVNKSLGPHALKMGVEFRSMRESIQTPVSRFGTFSFNRGFTQRDPLRGDAGSGNSVASFLLGYPAGGSVIFNIASAYQSLYYALFLQDDWRVTSRLTLNLGLRWDYESPFSERYDRQNRGFDPNAASPLQAPGLQLKGGLLFTDSKNRLPFKRDLNNFQPRVGAAYRIRAKTVLRGGFGVSYMPTFDTGQTNGFSVSTGYVSSTDGGLTPANRLSNPYPAGIVQPPGRTLGLATLLGQNISYSNYGRVIPRSVQFSFGVQHELPWRTLIDVSYIGNRASGLGAGKNINFVPADKYVSLGSDLLTQVTNPLAGLLPGSAFNGATVPRQQLLRPFPQFNNVTEYLRPVGKNRYNSLQVSVEKRLSQGAHFRASYTWNKTMAATGFLNEQDPFDSPVWVQESSPNQVFTLAGGYTLPFFAHSTAVVRQVLGGWQMYTIFRASSGTLIGAPGGAFSTGVNPALPKDQRTKARWFNTCTVMVTGVRQSCASASESVAFLQQPPYTLRTLSTQLPGIRTEVPLNVDFSLFKDFPIRERLKLQFRAEAFNLANTVMFGGPNMTLTSAAFGTVTPSQINDPRIIQLALKLAF